MGACPREILKNRLSANGVSRVTKSEDLAKYRLTEVANAVDGGENSVEVVGPEA